MSRVLLLSLAFICTNAQGGKPVTVYNFARAETDRTIRYVCDQIGFGVLHNDKALRSLDEQAVIRQNCDTLYSTAVLDLSEPATITLPDADTGPIIKRT